MKICLSCRATLPDGATFCVSCGSKELELKSDRIEIPDYVDDKPKIEYDQYGRPINKQPEQQQYDQYGRPIQGFNQPLPPIDLGNTDYSGYDNSQYQTQPQYQPQQGYAPQPQQYPPQQGYAPQPQQYPPQQGYAPQPQQYPPQQGYAPQPQQYPPQQGYASQPQQYPPQQGYAPQPQQYPPQQGYAPQPQQYPPQQGYAPEQYQQQQGYAPEQYQQPQQEYAPEQYQQPQQEYAPEQYQQPQQEYSPEQYQQPQPEYEEYEEIPQPKQTFAQEQYNKQHEIKKNIENDEEEETSNKKPAVEMPPIVDQSSVSFTPPEIKEGEANPYESMKDFKFEKKEEPEEQGEPKPKEKPKNFKEFIAMLKDTKDHTIEYDKNDINTYSKYALLSCFGITFWVPFAFCSNSRYAKFYSNQGLMVFLLEIVATIIYSVFFNIIGIACTVQNQITSGESLSIVGWILDILFFAIFYIVPIFMIYCGVNDVKAGKAKDMPILGSYLKIIR